MIFFPDLERDPRSKCSFPRFRPCSIVEEKEDQIGSIRKCRNKGSTVCQGIPNPEDIYVEDGIAYTFRCDGKYRDSRGKERLTNQSSAAIFSMNN